MTKTNKTISWFGSKGSEGKEIAKMAGQAIVITGALVLTGAVLGTVGKMFGGTNN